MSYYVRRNSGAASRLVTWQEAGTANRGDICIAHGEHSRVEGDTTVDVDVRLVSPTVGTSMTVPAFPPSIADLDLSDDAFLFRDLYLIDDVDRDGYASMVETADGDARFLHGRYGTATEVWIGGRATALN